MDMKHLHHILPRHMGGNNDPSNMNRYHFDNCKKKVIYG